MHHLRYLHFFSVFLINICELIGIFQKIILNKIGKNILIKKIDKDLVGDLGMSENTSLTGHD